MEGLVTHKVIYTARTRTVGGRDHGIVRSSDDRLQIKLSAPGTDDTGTNPEQLFAAGWSTCFEGAMEIVARKMRITFPQETVIDAEIDLCSGSRGEIFLQARLYITIPGVDGDIAQEIVDKTRKICPYSKAVEGNVNVQFILI